MASPTSSAVAAAELLTEEELEVIDVLSRLSDFVRRRGLEDLSWGRRRRRTLPDDRAQQNSSPAKEAAEEKRVVGGVGDVASPGTPLAFPVSSSEDEVIKKGNRRHTVWVEEQRGVVSCLSQENAHLRREIEEYKARLERSRTINANLRDLQSKNQLKQELEYQALGPELQLELNQVQLRSIIPATSVAANLIKYYNGKQSPMPSAYADRPMTWSPEEEASWHRRQQAAYKAAMSAKARQRRQEIRRSKNFMAPAMSMAAGAYVATLAQNVTQRHV